MVSRGGTRKLLTIVGLLLLVWIAVRVVLAMLSPNYLIIDLRLPVAIAAVVLVGLLTLRQRFRNR